MILCVPSGWDTRISPWNLNIAPCIHILVIFDYPSLGNDKLLIPTSYFFLFSTQDNIT